ncbi:MAG TPA: hypothetical protein VFA63_03945 [Pseudonocardiaceae bacterium]|nr:hypothetical protein [Pseudonocardiaceae bacterium]
MLSVGAVVILVVAGCAASPDPALSVDVDVVCTLVADAAGALVVDAGCWVAGVADALVAVPLLAAVVLGVGWLVVVVVGVPPAGFGIAWLAAVLGTTAAVVDSPGDCGATCPVAG